MDVGSRVYDTTIFVNFKVYVGASRAASGTDKRDVLPFVDDIADFDK